MERLDLNRFRPQLRRYVNVRDVEVLAGNANLLAFHIGNAPTNIRKITVSQEVLLIFFLADGSRTAYEIYSEILAVFPTLLESDFREILRSLYVERLIADESAEKLLPQTLFDRYQRHLLYYSFFSNSPQKHQMMLRNSVVAILGVGGIGTWLAYFLTAAGVGTLHLIDGDRIETSNLTRQVLYSSDDVGELKVNVAKKRLNSVNPDCEVFIHPKMISSKGDLDNLFRNVEPDLILASADRPETLLDWVDQYSVNNLVPWSPAGYADYVGVCGPLFVPGQTGCRACQCREIAPHDKFEFLPFVGDINKRFQPMSFGPLNGIVASIQSKEIISWLSGVDLTPPSLGSMVFFDATTLTSSFEPWLRRENCQRCSSLFK